MTNSKKVGEVEWLTAGSGGPSRGSAAKFQQAPSIGMNLLFANRQQLKQTNLPARISLLNLKTQAPTIVVFDEATPQVQSKVKVAGAPQKEILTSVAPVYDMFQPMLAHYSDTKNPKEMKECLKNILKRLVEQGIVDYYEESEFVFVGRAFGAYDDCEYRISIFSDSEHSSVTEIRRSCGEAFTFADAERLILQNLRKDGAIQNFQVYDTETETETEVDAEVEAEVEDETPAFDSKNKEEGDEDAGGGDEEDEDDEDEEEAAAAAAAAGNKNGDLKGSMMSLSTFTFGMLPDYHSLILDVPLDLPHYPISYNENSVDIGATPTTSTPQVIATATDVDIDEEEQKLDSRMHNQNIFSCAINEEKNSITQSDFRFHAVRLQKDIKRDPVSYGKIQGIISKLLTFAASQDNYDAFVIRTTLQSVVALLEAKTTFTGVISQSVKDIKKTWSEVVVRSVSGHLQFKFAPSQQVVKECDKILALLKDQE